MKTSLWLLPCIVLIELACIAGAVNWKKSLPTPPPLNLERFDELTTADFETLRGDVGSNAEAWRELGEACMAHGYFPEAEACLKHADQITPDQFETIYALAYTLQRMGRLEEALTEFRRARKLSSKRLATNCHYQMGLICLRMENVEHAESYFRRDPGYLPSVYQLAKILSRTDRVVEAVELVDSILKQNPDLLQPLQLRAQLAAAMGDEKLSVACQERADRTANSIPLSDHHEYLTPIRFKYGASRQVKELVHEQEQGDKLLAEQGYQALLSHLEFWDARRLIPTLAALEIELDRPKAAESLIREHFKSASITPEMLHLLGDAERASGRNSEAIETYLRVLKLRSDEMIHSKLQNVYQESENAELAKRHEARARHYRGVSAYRVGMLREAALNLQNAIELDPDYDQSWYYLGEAFRAAGALQKANEAYTHCLELNPNHSRAITAQNRLQRFRQ